MDVTMEDDALALDEVVVTAMGISRSEKTLGYSATTVKGDEITSARKSNVAEALSGKVAGVSVTSTSTDPGSANSIIIRGFGSINGSNQPLYIVDGVPLQNTTLTAMGKPTAVNGISNISSDDIASMTILKGAAATAIYGSRAANGVIVITTKTGSKGAERNFSIEYNGGLQLRQVAILPVYQNEFGQGWNGAQTFIENGSWGPKLDGSIQVYGPIWNNSQLIHEYSAVPDNVKDFFDLGVSNNHSISLSGQSSDSALSDDGIIPSDNDKYTRNTISYRTNYQAAPWLNVSSSVNIANTASDMVSQFQGASVIDGVLEFARDVSLYDKRDINNPFNNPTAYFTPYGITNPYWAVENNYNHLDSKQVYGKLQVDVNPFRHLTLTYRYGFDYTDYDRKIGSPQISVDTSLMTNDEGYSPSNMDQDGYVYTQYRRAYEFNNDFLANYNNKFIDDKLDINITAGVNINERANTSMGGETDVLTFYTGFWQLSNGANRTDLSESQSKRRLVGLFADATFGWADTFFIDLTARNDWSSTLPLANNNYFYPGITGSWIFSNNLPENNVLSFGKLRLAYGKTGNDASPYYTENVFSQGSVNGTYGSGIVSFPFNGVNAFLGSTTLASSTLRPEMTSEFEVGTNLQFFNGRIGLDAAYYNRTTTDQIFTLPAEPATGYSSMVTNFGSVNNHGIELLLNTTPVQTKNFRWDMDINFAINRNKVLSMPESLEGGKVTINSFSTSASKDAVYMYAEEGRPMGVFYTYVPTYAPTGELIVDEAGMPVLSDDLVDTGLDINNKWTGGINTSLTYKDITLSATLDVRYGGTMFSRTKNIMEFCGNGIVTTYNHRNPFIIPNSVVDNGDGTYSENTTPIYLADSSYQTYFDDYGAGEGRLYYLLDRSFAKLRNVSLTWNVPNKWVKGMHLSGLSASAFCNNVFTWTPAENVYVDPEATNEGTDLSAMFGETYVNPSCRIWGFNLNIKF
ncbi:MAG: SusC/RagA family TonB-linked outer membrane protein [Bacteroidia bacterium]|nr:SusC/RagA family TonB-linked outer membrane protein [Bacteroidia bacterium]